MYLLVLSENRKEIPKKTVLACETEETMKLSTTELQRLVLLEQLSLIRQKKALLNQGVQMIYTQSYDPPAPL
jgi:hypothetical protein